MTAKDRKVWIKRWCRELAQTPRGRVTLANLAEEMEQRYLPPTTARAFVASVAWLWSDPDVRAIYMPVDVLTLLVAQSPGVFLRKGTPRPRRALKYSRVCRFSDFLRYNVKLTKLGWSIGNLAEYDDYVRVLERDFAGKVKGTIPHAETSVAWLTHSDAIRDIRGRVGGAGVPEKVHQGLGLLHFALDPQLLVELRYPSRLRLDSMRAPTVLDAGAFAVYRTWRQTPDNWGRTVDLATGHRGVPEAVHGPTPVTERFTLESIGYVTTLTLKLDLDEIAQRGGTVFSWLRLAECVAKYG